MRKTLVNYLIDKPSEYKYFDVYVLDEVANGWVWVGDVVSSWWNVCEDYLVDRCDPEKKKIFLIER